MYPSGGYMSTETLGKNEFLLLRCGEYNTGKLGFGHLFDNFRVSLIFRKGDVFRPNLDVRPVFSVENLCFFLELGHETKVFQHFSASSRSTLLLVQKL